MGEDGPVPIDLERNKQATIELGAENPPDVPLFRFRLGLRAGFSGDRQAAIPIYRRTNENPHPVLKEIYYCEVVGATLEAANVNALRGKVARMLETLAPAGALPLAYFEVASADYSLPVYEQGGRIVCPMLAGADLKARSLAEMRRNVIKSLRNAGYVSDASQVEMRVVRPSDLRLVAPAAVIRNLDDPELWLPAVEGRSSEGLVVGLLGQSTELRPTPRRRAGALSFEDPPAASDVASLLRLVSNDLLESGALDDPYALHATQVQREIWQRTEQLTDDLHRRLVCWLEGDEPTRLELPLRHTAAGEFLVALEDAGISVFAAPEEELLAERVGRYLARSGFLRFQETIEVVGAEQSDGPADADEAALAGQGIEFPRLEFAADGPPPPASRDETTSDEPLQAETQEVNP